MNVILQSLKIFGNEHLGEIESIFVELLLCIAEDLSS